MRQDVCSSYLLCGSSISPRTALTPSLCQPYADKSVHSSSFIIKVVRSHALLPYKLMEEEKSSLVKLVDAHRETSYQHFRHINLSYKQSSDGLHVQNFTL